MRARDDFPDLHVATHAHMHMHTCPPFYSVTLPRSSSHNLCFSLYSHLDSNDLDGSLPPEWSTMTAVYRMYARCIDPVHVLIALRFPPSVAHLSVLLRDLTWTISPPNDVCNVQAPSINHLDWHPPSRLV
jgi:hypothetical protein